MFRLKQVTGIYGDCQGNGKKTKEILASCGVCPELLRQFENDSSEGIRLAQQMLVNRSDDERAMFLLAKMNLSKLWLNLQVLEKTVVSGSGGLSCTHLWTHPAEGIPSSGRLAVE
ncbi:MAG: hypothetical protein ACRD1R_05760 [Acidobacteriota bacterium]